MTPREIFEKVKSHLLKQNAPARQDGVGCMYRFDGLQCAVGCLISDEVYNPNFEGGAVGGMCSKSFAVRDALAKSGVDASDQTTIRMLVDLQNMHDGADVDVWPARLGEIEQTYFGGA